MEKIRLGLMSPGTWGRTILDALRDSDDDFLIEHVDHRLRPVFLTKRCQGGRENA